MTSRGLDYAGTLSITESGKTCLDWEDGKYKTHLNLSTSTSTIIR